MAHCLLCYLKYIPFLVVIIYMVSKNLKNLTFLFKKNDQKISIFKKNTEILSRCGKTENKCGCFLKDDLKPKEMY